MSVYVDSYNGKLGRMFMCHMIADTSEELLAMAESIELKREWLQNEGTVYEHFDVSLSKKAEAIKAGAIEVTCRELVFKIREKRQSS